jgi:hypothetical protein
MTSKRKNRSLLPRGSTKSVRKWQLRIVHEIRWTRQALHDLAVLSKFLSKTVDRIGHLRLRDESLTFLTEPSGASRTRKKGSSKLRSKKRSKQ